MATTSCMSRVDTWSASFRSAIGVGPACASIPVMLAAPNALQGTSVFRVLRLVRILRVLRLGKG